MTYSLPSPNHQEEEPSHGASKFTRTDPGNDLAEGPWHLWDEQPAFAHQCAGIIFFFVLNVLGPCILLMRRCNSTPASSTEKNCPLQIKGVTLSRLAGGRTAISGKRGGGVSPGWEAEAPTV